MSPTSPVRGHLAARCLRFFLLISMAISMLGLANAQPPPGSQTIWRFWQRYNGPDKIIRLLNSYSVGIISGGDTCTGTMISPHIMITAAHCGGPSWEGKTVRFFYIDEDANGPSPDFQRMSETYSARSFPWQRLTSPTGVQDSDFMMWWVENGSDGVPPGIKHGYLELNPSAVRQGDQAYTFWWNPLPPILPDTIFYSAGDARSFEPLHFTGYSVSLLQGGSGAAWVSGAEQTIIGVNATEANAADSAYVLSLHDGDGNSVLDAVEHDLLTAESPRDFRLLTFSTPLQRSQWRPGLTAEFRQVTHARPVLQGVPLGDQAVQWLGQVGGWKEGPRWYRACWNAWEKADEGKLVCTPPSGFFVENFEDGQLNTPGVRASAGVVLKPGPGTDSVDFDDGNLDHNGNNGHSFLSNGPAGITFTFDRAGLPRLPTWAGIVWTDGEGETSAEAFDAHGGSLGVIGPVAIADNSFQGTDADDRFFGFTNAGGISAIRISNTRGGIEVDHLKYDTRPLSNTSDLSYPNARYVPGNTYRITAAVYGLSLSPVDGTIRFESPKGGATRTINFQTINGAWKRVTGRVTLTNQIGLPGPTADDYRLVFGAPAGSAYYVSNVAIIREGSPLNFQTGEERQSWEYVGGAHPTSWGINGAGDFSGVVVGPSPANGWSLRQRYIALEPNQSYDITFVVKHHSGALTAVNFMRIENLSAVRAGEVTWGFARRRQQQTLTLRVSTGNEHGNAIVFGSNNQCTYMVDNIRIARVPLLELPRPRGRVP